MTYEEIGKISVDYFLAERERVKAKIQRAIERDSHKCLFNEKEYEESNTGASGYFCYHGQGYGFYHHDFPFEEWCDNCKHVQPFHLAYIESAKKARLARYQLTRRIKSYLKE